MTAEPRVVLDACVFIPQYLRDTLLSVLFALSRIFKSYYLFDFQEKSLALGLLR